MAGEIPVKDRLKISKRPVKNGKGRLKTGKRPVKAGKIPVKGP